MRTPFRHLWVAQTLSAVGDSVTALAIPLTAIALNASTLTIGLLSAASIIGYLVIGLPAGAWLDRVRKHPVLVTADVARAVLLAVIPVAYLLGHLSMALLFVVAFAHSVCSAVFSIAYQAYLPRIVDTDELVAANSKLQGTQFVAQVAGPNLAGVLVQILTAPLSLLADVVTFVLSAVFVGTIRHREPAPEPAQHGMARSVAEGFRFLARQPVLRVFVAYAATANLASSAATALSAVFLARTVGLSPLWIGIAFSSATAGGIVGSLLAGRARKTLGLVNVFWLPLTIAGLVRFAIPFTGTGWAIMFFVVGSFLPIAATAIFNINSAAYRQTITPASMLSRVTACTQFITWGILPLGAVVGGLLGQYLPMRTALAVIIAWHGLSAIWFLSPRLRAGLRARELEERDNAAQAHPAAG